MIQRLFPPPRKTPRVLRALYELADLLCSAMLVLGLMFSFALRFAWVMGNSMQPTLQNRQPLLLSAFVGNIDYGDIVVVSDDGTQLPDVIVKRVIGLPGDLIDIDFEAGVVHRNGEALREDYIALADHFSYGDISFPLTVEPGTVFLLGDNRNYSLDSRNSAIGLIDQRYLIGRVLLRRRV